VNHKIIFGPQVLEILLGVDSIFNKVIRLTSRLIGSTKVEPNKIRFFRDEIEKPYLFDSTLVQKNPPGTNLITLFACFDC